MKQQHNKPLMIVKASGDQEPFSFEKYKRSLHRSGVPNDQIQKIIDALEPQLHSGMSTKELYKKTFNLLKQLSPTTAGRYSLKEALRLLGPSGFPFEKIVSKIFAEQKYNVALDQIVQGKCVTHEVDVILTDSRKNQAMVECKFHNSYGLITDVHTTLYVKARFDDIHTVHPIIKECWLVTNTKFSQDATTYGTCVGINLLSWGYPASQGLETLIETYRLYPITTLTTLTPQERTMLLQANITLCSDLIAHIHDSQLPIAQERRTQLVKECSSLCSD